MERLEASHKLSQTEKGLSAVLYEHGVDDQGFSKIRSKRGQALFDGYSTIQVLADFLPTITIKAKDFASEITHFNDQ